MNTESRPLRHEGSSTSYGPIVRGLLWALVVLGIAVPWYFNVAYFMSGGHVVPSIFFRDVAANDLTTAITIDVYLAAVAFSVWAIHEKRVNRPWLYVVACFALGLSFALPLYLLHRKASDAATVR